MRRRDLLAALAGLPAGLGSLRPDAGAAPAVHRRSLRLLILGGTGFLGPLVVAAARRSGFAVTLFNRGRTNPGLFQDAAGVEQILGDRQAGLAPLRSRSWDVVLDTSAHVPRLAREAAQLLRGSAGQYIYVSTTAVYRDRDRALDESAETAPLPASADARAERVTDVTYGPLKALCEQEVRRAFADRAQILRLGHLVGPTDPTDRLAYWLARSARGGELAAPGVPSDPVQILDARDLADWIVTCADRGLGGTYNAVGPQAPLTMDQLLRTCRSVVGGSARVTWARAELLRQLGFLDRLPLWRPPSEVGLSRVSVQRALAQGLRLRPLTTTIRDTWQWFRGLPSARQQALHAGLRASEESQLLTALHSRQAQR